MIFKKLLAVCAAVFTVAVCVSCECNHQWKEADCITPRTCEKCGLTEGDALGHDYQEATCNYAQICSRCGAALGEPLGHSVASWEKVENSTCEKAGTQKGICERCGQEIVEKLPLAEHVPGEWTVFTDATETTPGVRKKYCTVCNKELQSENFSLSPEEIKRNYIAQCETYSYQQISRSPQDYSGKKAALMGQVIQVMEDGVDYTLRVNITLGRYSWEDTILVSYTKQNFDEARILEDDIVMMYGTLRGTQTYTSVMNASITIPYLEAKYIDIL